MKPLSNPGRENRMEQVVSVVIRGEQYTIRAAEDPSYVRQVAAYVDTKLDGVMASSQALPPTKAVVLASLNIADELFKAEAERERSERLIAVKLGTLSELLRTAIEEGFSEPRGVDRESEIRGA